MPSIHILVGTMKSPTEVDGSLSALFLLIGPLDLIGMWFGKDQRANMIKTHV